MGRKKNLSQGIPASMMAESPGIPQMAAPPTAPTTPTSPMPMSTPTPPAKPPQKPRVVKMPAGFKKKSFKG
jgi:hypothetical protein